MPRNTKAVTIFLLLMAALLAFYIATQSASQVQMGQSAVEQRSSVVDCGSVVFSVRGIEESGGSLSMTIANEDYSSGRIEKVVVSSGGDVRAETLGIEPGIERRVRLDSFRVRGNYTVYVNECKDYGKLCTSSGCRARV